MSTFIFILSCLKTLTLSQQICFISDLIAVCTLEDILQGGLIKRSFILQRQRDGSGRCLKRGLHGATDDLSSVKGTNIYGCGLKDL